MDTCRVGTRLHNILMSPTDILVAGMLLFTPAHAAQPDDGSVECLALNMYHEARGQGTAGLLGVTAVVFNRVKDKRFPNTICEVIEQGPTRESWKKNGEFYPIRHRCQFSWFCDGRSDIPKEIEVYSKFLRIARAMIDKNIPFIDITEGALWYHADTVNPYWSEQLKRTVTIDTHLFYN